MLKQLRRVVKGILGDTVRQKDGSVVISDESIIKAFKDNPDNTFLVSFPRTGSHWLRMLMELYFHRPSLVRIFYYPQQGDYLTLHTHDLELDVERLNVVYLYRDPVDTVYSQLRYYRENTNDRERIAFWADLYGRHLDKWLHRERFTRHKTVVRYESMKRDLTEEFRKVVRHFDEGLDEAEFERVAGMVTKGEVRRKTKDDPQVVKARKSYRIARNKFRAENGEFVWNVLLRNRAYLLDYFKGEEPAGP